MNLARIAARVAAPSGNSFNVNVQLSLRGSVPVEAASLEEALKKVSSMKAGDLVAAMAISSADASLSDPASSLPPNAEATWSPAVASSPRRVAGPGGDGMAQPNWKDLQNTLFNALDNVELSPGSAETFDFVGGLDDLNAEHGVNFSAIVDDAGNLGVQVSFEGDNEVVWQGALASFDEAAKQQAASAAIAAAQQMLAQ